MADEHRVHAGAGDGRWRGRSAGRRAGRLSLGLVGMIGVGACGASSAWQWTSQSLSAVDLAVSGETMSTVGSVATGADAPRETQTWRVRPSFKYDVLCLLNVLTGDPYYLKYYQAEYDRLEPGLTPKVRSALANLQREIKTEGGGIVSAMLTLYFSVVEDSTLAQMSARLDDLEPMRRALQETPYYREEGWRTFVSIADDLQVVFQHLAGLDYERDWAVQHLPTLETSSTDLAAELPKWSLLREVARLTGMPERAGPVEIIVLFFNQPHGIRITGTRYLTYSGWPLKIVLNDAIHEMLHPPYDRESDPKLRRAIEGLRASNFVMDKVEKHNPSLGYNTLEGLIEEDVVQVFEQVLAERAGIAEHPRDRWRTSDEGIHVFAAALYHVLRSDGFEVGDETIAELLTRNLTTGALRPGNVRAMYEEFYAPGPAGR